MVVVRGLNVFAGQVRRAAPPRLDARLAAAAVTPVTPNRRVLHRRKCAKTPVFSAVKKVTKTRVKTGRKRTESDKRHYVN